MPNDAKFGLILGVALVLVIAAIFFRRDASTQAPDAHAVRPAAARSLMMMPPSVPKVEVGTLGAESSAAQRIE